MVSKIYSAYQQQPTRNWAKFMKNTRNNKFWRQFSPKFWWTSPRRRHLAQTVRFLREKRRTFEKVRSQPGDLLFPWSWECRNEKVIKKFSQKLLFNLLKHGNKKYSFKLKKEFKQCFLKHNVPVTLKKNNRKIFKKCLKVRNNDFSCNATFSWPS